MSHKGTVFPLLKGEFKKEKMLLSKTNYLTLE